MSVFDKIQIIAKGYSNEFLEKAIADGKKAIGYFGSYVPEEIIHAAGFIPYRMRAVQSDGTTKGDIYFSSLNCTFVRRCFGKAINGDFKFLDGIIITNGCDHIRRIYDNWRHADIAPSFRYMFVTPHLCNSLALERYKQEIIKFKNSIESNFNITITDKMLNNSIELYNKKRSLLMEIYRSRKQKILSIKGSEFLSLMLAITMMPVEDSIVLLEKVTEEIKDRKVSSNHDIRIFLASGCLEESSHLELLEDCGCAIVADNLGLGTRHMDMPVNPDSDNISALSERYLNHMSCPRMMDDFKRRLNFMNTSRNEYSADAVIGEKLKFCDLWGGEIYLMKQEGGKNNFPILALERELYDSGDGQIRTRVQAFIEQIRNHNIPDN